jgi:hypothetical protein
MSGTIGVFVSKNLLKRQGHMNHFLPHKKPDNRIAGSSLVELLVSSVLVSFAVAAVVAVVVTGMQLSTSDNDRREARSIVRSIIEQRYDYKNYSTIPETYSAANTVEIDKRDGASLTGELSERVVTSTVATDNGTNIPVREVTVVLKWSEVDGVSDSIKLIKRLAQI